jgi:type VI secretion system protein ImpG
MIDDLIEYYQRELAFLRNNAGAFAEAHPKIASRLRVTRESMEDPHVGRLIEAVAFLNARLRHKLDEDYAELSDALLLTLYPHLIQPLPSLMITRLNPAPDLDKTTVIPAGTMFSTEVVDGEACRYRLCHETVLQPLQLTTASMSGPPFVAPAAVMGRQIQGTRGVLRLTLEVTKPEVEIATLDLTRLRVFIRADARRAQILLEHLGVNLLGVAVADGPGDERPVLLDPGCVRLLGLEEADLLLPQDATAKRSYALLQEHFAYPQKHLFFEIAGIDRRALDLAGPRIELFFYFDQLSPELERVVRAEDFDIHAAPAVNLFDMDAEPIQLDQSALEYRVIPSAQREDVIEVQSIREVVLQTGTGERIVAPPLYAIGHGSPSLGQFFHGLARRASFSPGGGDDVFVTIADLRGDLLTDHDTVVRTRVTATNRDLPARLPFGGGRPHLNLIGTINGLAGLSALTKPTPPRRPGRRRAANWKLIGQLSINYLSLVGGATGARALGEVLALYDTAETVESVHLRDRLVGVTAEAGVARIRLRGHAALASGVDVTLEVDDERLSGSGSFILCAVIERFLASTCALNSFVRMTVRLRHESHGWKTWPARMGTRPLI